MCTERRSNDAPGSDRLIWIRPRYRPSSACTFLPGKALNGNNLASGSVGSREACCGACAATEGCVASDFVEASPMRPTFEGVMSGGTCNLKATFQPKHEISGEVQTACKQP